MAKSIVIAVLLAVLGFVPLLGLPGALLLSLTSPTTNLIYGPLAYEAWERDLAASMWPVAIFVSLAWPIWIPLVNLLLGVVFEKRRIGTAAYYAIFALAVFSGAFALAQTAVVLSGPPHRLSKGEVVTLAAQLGEVSILKKHYKAEDLGAIEPDPLLHAIFARHAETSLFLLSQRQDFSRYFPEGDQQSVQFATPLHTAVNVAELEIIKALLEGKADPNRRNAVGQTAAHALSWDPDGTAEIIDILVAAGADLNIADANGDTPLLHLTRIINYWPSMSVYAEKMIVAGADPQHRNRQGLSAADLARENHQMETLEVLERFRGR